MLINGLNKPNEFTESIILVLKDFFSDVFQENA